MPSVLPRGVRILIVDDEPAFRQVLSQRLQWLGAQCSVAASGSEAIEFCGRQEPHVAVLDLRMAETDGLQTLERLKTSWPAIEIVMLTGFGSIESAVRAMKLGACDYLQKSAEPSEIERILKGACERAILRLGTVEQRNRLMETQGYLGLAGRSEGMREVVNLIDKFKDLSQPVLIEGESGTGKELVARAIHFSSARRTRSFIPVNCAAVSETLLVSELFGHTQGAYTGALKAKPGLIDIAEGGTLLLDEITETSTSSQAALLRVVETGEYFPVGSTEVHRADTRIVATTNRDLQNAVTEGRFRQDLFFRLSSLQIRIPPLRERMEDLPVLVEFFLGTSPVALARKASLSAEVLQWLSSYDWPGNVRELFNVLHRAVVLSDGPVVGVAQIALLTQPRARNPKGEHVEPASLDAVEKRHIRFVLAAEKWDTSKVARILGIDRRTLMRKIERYRLAPGKAPEPSAHPKPDSW